MVAQVFKLLPVATLTVYCHACFISHYIEAGILSTGSDHGTSFVPIELH